MHAVPGYWWSTFCLSDLLIDFDMAVYEVNETDPFLIVEVELVSVIEREIQLQLESKDDRATGQAYKRNFCTHNM